MSKINSKLIDEVFDDSVLDALPTNDKINIGVGRAKQAEKIRGRKSPEHSKRMTELMTTRHQENPFTEEQLARIKESNKKFREENPLTEEKKKRIGDAMRGKTLEELIGEERAAEGRKKRSEAHKGKKRPEEVVAKIASTRKATGSYDSPTHGMNGKTHKESTKEIQGQKARIRQELKRKLGLGKSDSVPKDLLEKEYKKQGLL
jgi:hypothetical protein